MNQPHQRRNELGEPVYEKVTDQNKSFRWSLEIERWFKLFWPLITVLAGGFMASVWGPLRQIPTLTAEVATMSEQHVIFAKADSTGLNRDADMAYAIAILTRLECLKTSDTERAASGIHCTDIPLPRR
jgi:hypothetical protein